MVRRLLADAETPLGVYRKLAQDAPATFLLESAEHGGVWSRYSIVGARCSATLTEVDGEAYWIGEPPVGLPDVRRPDGRRCATPSRPCARPRWTGLPPLTGGLVGALTYDVVRRWERLPDDNTDDLGLPELTMMLATDLAVLDHADGSLLLVANAVNQRRHRRAGRRGLGGRRDPAGPHGRAARPPGAEHRRRARATRNPRSAPSSSTPSTRQMVERAKEAVRAGDVFQVVPSQRYEIDCPADALDVYRVLRASNPSPYMYLLRLPTAGRRHLRRRRVQPGGAGQGRRPAGDDAPHRRHPTARGRPRSRTPRTPSRCWPTPRSGPST